MHPRILVATAFAATSLLALAPASRAQRAYALTAPGTGLYQLDLTSRSVQSFTSSGAFANGDTALVDLGFRAANGLLYGLAASGDVYGFQQFMGNFVGGAPTLTVTPSTALPAITHGAFSPVTGNVTLLGSNDHLYNEAFSSGQVTDLGLLAYAGGGVAPDLVALAFSGTGTLYGVDFSRSALVNLSSRTVVGALGTTLTSDVGLSFASDGSARLTQLDSSGTGNVLYRVDPASGAATLLGAVTNQFSAVLPPFEGLAIVPEPTTTALVVGVGVAALAAGARRCRRAPARS